MKMKRCVIECLPRLSLISGTPLNIDHKLWTCTLANTFCGKLILDIMLSYKASLIVIIFESCGLVLSLKWNYVFERKAVKWEMCSNPLSSVHFDENDRSLRWTSFLNRLMSNGCSVKKWNRKNIRSFHIEKDVLSRPIAFLSIFASLRTTSLHRFLSIEDKSRKQK